MRARKGDWIVVKGRTVSLPEQRCLVLETGTPEGVPPYRVRWLADDHESIFFPGPDAQVYTPGEMTAADERERARLTAVQKALAARAPGRSTR